MNIPYPEDSIAALVNRVVALSITRQREERVTVLGEKEFARACDYIRAHFTVVEGTMIPGRWVMKGIYSQAFPLPPGEFAFALRVSHT